MVLGLVTHQLKVDKDHWLIVITITIVKGLLLLNKSLQHHFHIFFKQFGKYLQDEKIKNIVEFVGNYRFLKLFYDESGQGMYDKEFK